MQTAAVLHFTVWKTTHRPNQRWRTNQNNFNQWPCDLTRSISACFSYFSKKARHEKPTVVWPRSFPPPPRPSCRCTPQLPRPLHFNLVAIPRANMNPWLLKRTFPHFWRHTCSNISEFVSTWLGENDTSNYFHLTVQQIIFPKPKQVNRC